LRGPFPFVGGLLKHHRHPGFHVPGAGCVRALGVRRGECPPRWPISFSPGSRVRHFCPALAEVGRHELHTPNAAVRSISERCTLNSERLSELCALLTAASPRIGGRRMSTRGRIASARESIASLPRGSRLLAYGCQMSTHTAVSHLIAAAGLVVGVRAARPPNSRIFNAGIFAQTVMGGTPCPGARLAWSSPARPAPGWLTSLAYGTGCMEPSRADASASDRPPAPCSGQDCSGRAEKARCIRTNRLPRCHLDEERRRKSF
jgi:hypothetical protein